MSTVFLQLQSTAQNTIVEAGSIIRFDRVLDQSEPNHFSYDSNTGVITLNEAGIYAVDWSVMTETSGGNVVVSLQTSAGTSIIGDSSQKMGEVSSAAIIRADAPGLQLYLRNGFNGIQLGAVPVAANLVIHSLACGEAADIIAGKPVSGAVVNFQSGIIDWAEPRTWPILLNILPAAVPEEQIVKLRDIATAPGIEGVLGLEAGSLSNPIFSAALNVVLSPLAVSLDGLLDELKPIPDALAMAGLVSLDTYIGHANVGVVPSFAGTVIPSPDLAVGPPYPQLIAKSGKITSFAAEYDCLMSVDLRMNNAVSFRVDNLNTHINMVNDTLLKVISLLQQSLSPLLVATGVELPDNYADILGSLMLSPINDGFPSKDFRILSKLWHGRPASGEALSENTSWQLAAVVDLGEVLFAEMVPADLFIGSLNNADLKPGNPMDSFFKFLGSKGSGSRMAFNTPFKSAVITGLEYPIQAGDYLMVQYTLERTEYSTILAGVIASNAMAGIVIE